MFRFEGFLILLCFVWLLYSNGVYFVSAVIAHVPDLFQIKLNGVEIEAETEKINVIEGTSPKLECNHKLNNNISVVWYIKLHVTESPVGPTTQKEKTLTLPNIKRGPSRYVKCETTGSFISEYRPLSINVQYPPSMPRISGPFVVSRNDSFNLTCEVDSEPEATIWWTEETTYYAPKISEKPEISMNVTDSNDIVLYCIAYNVMRPTVGQPIQSKSVSAKWYIIVKDKETAETPAPCPDINVGRATTHITQQITQDVTTVITMSKRRTVPPSTRPTMSTQPMTNTTDEPQNEETMVTVLPGWQVGLVATSMCGWIVAAIAVIAAVALCCWSRRNRRSYRINTDVTPERCTEATRNEYTPSPSQSTSYAPEVPTAPLSKPPSPKSGFSLRYQNVMQTDSPWVTGRQSNLTSCDTEWRDERLSSTRQPYSSQETHYMNYPYSCVNDMVPYDDCIIPSQKTKLVIETTHV